MKPIKNSRTSNELRVGDKVRATRNGSEWSRRERVDEYNQTTRSHGTLFDYLTGETGVVVGILRSDITINMDNGRRYVGASIANWEIVE